jgi:hypothetical protein
MSVYLSTQKREEQLTSNRGFPVAQLAIKLRAAALAMIMAGAATSASAAPPAASGNSSSLALGDSVVFGYIAADGYAYVNPSNFVGYPDYVGRDLRLDTVNAACPGETSSSFISSAGADFGCRGFRANFPLHVSYTFTQLDFATNFLATHKQTRLVTISLGADDGFLLQESCNGDPACFVAPASGFISGESRGISKGFRDRPGARGRITGRRACYRAIRLDTAEAID